MLTLRGISSRALKDKKSSDDIRRMAVFCIACLEEPSVCVSEKATEPVARKAFEAYQSIFKSDRDTWGCISSIKKQAWFAAARSILAVQGKVEP